MKRAVDIAISLLALALLSPLLLAAAVAILVESGRPVLYRHARIGLGGREFQMYKFRSMVRDAAARGPYHTLDQDPRITPVGRWLRRTSIDELPQLWNVLKGDMSVVGPRPDLPVQRGLYSTADWEARCSVRPGLTGLAQALIRSGGKEGERLSLDLQYVREHGFWLDLKILWLTLGRLSGKGSN